MALNICVLYGSVRTQREGIKAAHYVMSQLKQSGHQVTLIDAKEENLPLLDKRYMDYGKGEAPANLERLAELYRNTDAFVIVTGEYNASLQPGLSNLLDYFYHEYFHRPVGILSYSVGNFGGIRAGVQLRATIPALGMISIPTPLLISGIMNAFDEEGHPTDASLPKRTKDFLDELAWYGQALKSERSKGLPGQI
jgi:NAD(P)H-dependent FMN reductase